MKKFFTEYLPLALLAGFLSLLVATIFLGMLTAPLANNILAANIKKELVNTPLPAKTQLCDSISKAGKLMGNGNGIQFFGAILLKSDLTQDELESYYAPYRAQERTFLIESQTEQKIDAQIEHHDLYFDYHIPPENEENYYIVFSWGASNYPFSEFDFRGH